MSLLNPLVTTRSLREFFPSHVKALTANRSIDSTLPVDASSYLNVVQKEFLSRELGFSVSRVLTVRQVHGNRVLVVSSGDLDKPLEEADGILTDQCDLPIAVRTADCLSVFMYDPRHEVIGVIHAGWRSSYQRILEETVSLMRQHWVCSPADLRVAFGPAIRSCCYQVDAVFCDYFKKETHQRKKDFFLDLPAVNKNQLVRLGVEDNNIFDVGICTCCNHDYFSYRREKEAAGRMISLMVLRNSRKP